VRARTKTRAASVLAALALLASCATRPTDYPLATGAANQTQAPLDPSPDHPFVVLTFSGGGSRAAVLAAAVVRRLNDLHYTTGGESRALSSDIAVVSSVSGGSVYAADLGLNGPAHAASFMRRVQDFDGIGWLASRAINPFMWASLKLQGKTRIDVLQDMIEDLLQTKATMGALNQPGKQLTLLNSTDMVAGQVFTFDRATLDDLCMDYDRVPVSLGVTASAAFPIAFTPVLLRNDSYLPPGCPGQRNANLPYRLPLQLADGSYDNLETYRIARYRQALRKESVHEQGSNDVTPPFRTPVYLRLVDGGVADNSGLTALRRALLAAGAPADIGRLTAQGKLRQLVIISVNARSDPRNDLDTSNEYTTALTMADNISGSLVDSASSYSAAVFQSFIETLKGDRDRLVKEGQKSADFSVYPITIDFDQMPGVTETERQEQMKVKSIATSWTLQDGDVALLDRVAGALLWRHPCFRTLVSDIGLQGDPEAAAVPRANCPMDRPQPPLRARARPPV
jgi:NTE family protein